MGRPLRTEGRQTRQAILDAALKLFAENGYYGTSLRDIASAVGVRESALYNYFPRKEALFDALIVADTEYKAERLAAVLEDPIADIRATLERLAMMALESFCAPRQEQLFRMVMADGMRLAREGRINLFERMSSGLARMRELMQRLVLEGRLRNVDPELLVMEFVGPLLLWRHLNAIRSDHPLIADRDGFARGHVDQFLRGADSRLRRPRARSVPGVASVPPAPSHRLTSRVRFRQRRGD